MSDLGSTIAAFLASPPYYPCLVLANLDIRRLEEAAAEILASYRWPSLSVGRELSTLLISEQPGSRPRIARQWIEDALQELRPGPALVTEIAILFEPTLGLDPLAILRQASRVTALVVTWPGSQTGGDLSYAVPEHRHYRHWRRAEVPIMTID